MQTDFHCIQQRYPVAYLGEEQRQQALSGNEKIASTKIASAKMAAGAAHCMELPCYTSVVFKPICISV